MLRARSHEAINDRFFPDDKSTLRLGQFAPVCVCSFARQNSPPAQPAPLLFRMEPCLTAVSTTPALISPVDGAALRRAQVCGHPQELLAGGRRGGHDRGAGGRQELRLQQPQPQRQGAVGGRLHTSPLLWVVAWAPSGLFEVSANTHPKEVYASSHAWRVTYRAGVQADHHCRTYVWES